MSNVSITDPRVMTGVQRPPAAPLSSRFQGAWARLLRDVPALLSRTGGDPGEDELVCATVIEGVRYSLVRTVIDAGAHGDEHPAAVTLSGREREIARMVAKGYTNKTIAAVLDISTWTVDTYLRRVFGKLDVRSRSAMVNRLTRDGTLDDQDTPDWSEAWRAATGGHRRAS